MRLSKYIYLICAIVYTISFVQAKENTPIHQGMQGISNPACIKAVKVVEGAHLLGLPMRTHPIVDKKQPNAHTFSALSIIDYRGDDSHITISASPTQQGKCDVVYMESFAFPEPCPIAREELFKKWNFIGKMQGSLVFAFRRDKDFFAYLTGQGLGKFCMVTKRKVYLGL